MYMYMYNHACDHETSLSLVLTDIELYVLVGFEELLHVLMKTVSVEGVSAITIVKLTSDKPSTKVSN